MFGTNVGRRRAVLKVLARGAMTASELAERLGGEVNGHLTRTLQELEYAGFVAREANLTNSGSAECFVRAYSTRLGITSGGGVW